MRIHLCRAAPSLAWIFAALLGACQQVDQPLPFDVDPRSDGSGSIGANGGIVSMLPHLAIVFPRGAFATTTAVTLSRRDSLFPPDAGGVVPGRAFDVGPRGRALLVPARVQMAVPSELLGPREDIRLAVALLRSTGRVVTRVLSYDTANGLLFADVEELGPMAAVVSLDAIPALDVANLPNLGGGSIAPPRPVSSFPSGAVRAPQFGGVEFHASCSGDSRNCFASGILKIWVDDVVRARMGEDIALLGGSVNASLEFFSFDSFGMPRMAVGFLEIDGELRARFNRVVSGRGIDDELVFRTGTGSTPTPTAVAFAGNEMVFAATSEGLSDRMTFGVTGIGTGEQLTVRLEGDIQFENAGSLAPDVGQIVAHVRLRR